MKLATYSTLVGALLALLAFGQDAQRRKPYDCKNIDPDACYILSQADDTGESIGYDLKITDCSTERLLSVLRAAREHLPRGREGQEFQPFGGMTYAPGLIEQWTEKDGKRWTVAPLSAAEKLRAEIKQAELENETNLNHQRKLAAALEEIDAVLKACAPKSKP